jgi:hypothetical protein
VWEVEYTDAFGSWWDQLTEDEQERVTAGDKSHRWSTWYAEAIPVADALYDEHLQTLRDEGGVP